MVISSFGDLIIKRHMLTRGAWQHKTMTISASRTDYMETQPRNNICPTFPELPEHHSSNQEKKCTRAFWSVIAFATSCPNGGHSLMGLPEILGNTCRRQSACGSFAEVYLHQSGTTLCICGGPGFREAGFQIRQETQCKEITVTLSALRIK